MLVKGDNVLITEYNEDLDAWVLYGCARSCSLTLSTSVIETSVTGAQGWQTNVPAQHSFTGAIEGLVNLEEDNLLSLADLRARQIARTKLRLRFQRTAIDGITVYSEEADFFIVNSSDEGALNQMNSFTVEFIGTGALTQVFTPAEILANVKRYEYTGIGDETFFTAPSLIGKTILAVNKDGMGNSKMIVSGTPTDKQVRLTGAYVSDKEVLITTGVFTFAVPFYAGEEAYVLYR